ncbi:MAG: hypothetical protein ACKVON_14475 [Beijerinckiaceae bacterium]
MRRKVDLRLYSVTDTSLSSGRGIADPEGAARGLCSTVDLALAARMISAE